jgi:GNAT superfamily N-acetyltransferase
MPSNPEPLTFVEITSLNDDLLLPWLDLYETSFPASERILVSGILKMLKDNIRGLPVAEHLIAGLDGDGSLSGNSLFSAPQDGNVAVLWYMAVDPSRRSGGIGTRLYQDVLQRIATPGRQALIYEVEIAHAGDELAERRIRFYQRQGAHLLKGIHYLQHIGSHQAPIPMHIMIHPLVALDARQAYDLAKGYFGDAVKQIGEFRLE